MVYKNNDDHHANVWKHNGSLLYSCLVIVYTCGLQSSLFLLDPETQVDSHLQSPNFSFSLILLHNLSYGGASPV